MVICASFLSRWCSSIGLTVGRTGDTHFSTQSRNICVRVITPPFVSFSTVHTSFWRSVCGFLVWIVSSSDKEWHSLQQFFHLNTFQRSEKVKLKIKVREFSLFKSISIPLITLRPLWFFSQTSFVGPDLQVVNYWFKVKRNPPGAEGVQSGKTQIIGWIIQSLQTGDFHMKENKILTGC